MSVIEQLRRSIGKIDRRAAIASRTETMARSDAPRNILPLGLACCDAALGGGVRRGALHEIMPALPSDLGAATGFTAALAARLSQSDDTPVIVWVQQRDAMREHGRLYGEGLRQFGLPLHTLLAVRVAKPTDTLWAMEEALAIGIPLVVGELPQPGKATLTATRRLSLAAQTGNGLGLLLHHQPQQAPSAALTRWQISPAPSLADRFGGLGRPAFDLSLVKNRHGPCGRWLAHWHSHDCAFLTPEQLAATFRQPALSRGLFPLSDDEPDRTKSGFFRQFVPAFGRHRLAS